MIFAGPRTWPAFVLVFWYVFGLHVEIINSTTHWVVSENGKIQPQVRIIKCHFNQIHQKIVLIYFFNSSTWNYFSINWISSKERVLMNKKICLKNFCVLQKLEVVVVVSKYTRISIQGWIQILIDHLGLLTGFEG